MIKISSMVGAPDLGERTLAPYQGDLDEAFARLAALGYDGVELMMRDPEQLDGAAIRTSLAANGLQLAGLCTGHLYQEDKMGLVDPDPEVCRRTMVRMKAIADFAGGFGPGTIVNIGRSRGKGDPRGLDVTLQRMAAAFQELADYAAPLGVRWVLEPVNSMLCANIHTSQEGLAMVRRVGRPNLGLMLDVFHMNIEDVDIYTSIREAGELCWFVHFTDNNRHYPGSAHLDFGRIVATLREIGYDGYVSLEILPWPDGDTAARESIAYLRRFIPRAV
ncbi:MAG: sugar phosphate isomerase/epimerase family protein [Anaerolineae bacterium]